MKQRKLLNFWRSWKSLTAAALFSVSGAAHAQLSGTVTVGTGGTYSTLTALATAISGSGVSGALTVDFVSDVTESSTVTFTQNATNSTSSTKTITINGNGKKFISSATYAGIALNGMDYMTIAGLVIQRTSTSATQWGVHFYGQADYNTLKNCTIEYTAMSTGSTAGGAYVVFSASTTSPTSMTSTYNGRYNVVDNNLMRTTSSNSPGPTYAITDMGSSSLYSSTASNNTFKNNTIQNYYYMGIYNYYTNGEEFLNNDISRANSTSNNAYSLTYIFYNYYTYSTNRSTRIEGNKIHDLPYAGAVAAASGYTSTVYGMYNYYNYGTAANNFTIKGNTFENIVCASSNYFTYSYYNYYANVDGNTIRNWRSLGTSAYCYGFYMYYQYSGHKFNNNVIEKCFTKYYTYFVYLYYGDKQEITGNVIKNNVTADGSTAYTYAWYVYSPSTSFTHIFEDNTMDSNDFGCYTYGHYFYYWNGTFNRNKITNNRIYNANYSGYYGYFYATAHQYYYNFQCNNNLFANNLGTYGAFALYCYSYNSGTYYAEFKQNTVKDDHSKSSYAYPYVYGLYLYPYYHTKVNVIGNIVDVQNTYGCYPAYAYNANGAGAFLWNYNNYYLKNVSYQYWYCNNGSANDLNGWNGLAFAGTSETGHLPVYKDLTKNDYRVDVFELQNRVPQ